MEKKFIFLNSGWSHKRIIAEVKSIEPLPICVNTWDGIIPLNKVVLGDYFAGIVGIEGFLSRKQCEELGNGKTLEEIGFEEPSEEKKLDYLGFNLIGDKKIEYKYSDARGGTTEYLPVRDRNIITLSGETDEEINNALRLWVEVNSNEELLEDALEVIYFYEYEIC